MIFKSAFRFASEKSYKSQMKKLSLVFKVYLSHEQICDVVNIVLIVWKLLKRLQSDRQTDCRHARICGCDEIKLPARLEPVSDVYNLTTGRKKNPDTSSGEIVT